MKNKTLVILAGMVPFKNKRENVYFQKSITSFYPKKENNLIHRIFACAKMVQIVYNSIIRGNCDKIIIFDSFAAHRNLRLINICFPHARKIIYFRNRIKDKRQLRLITEWKNNNYEMWSYDETDCKEYGMNYNPQVLDRGLFASEENKTLKYDAVFLGNTKGRDALIHDIHSAMDKLGLKSLFYVHDYDLKQAHECEVTDRLIPYEEYIKIVFQSKAVIDILNEGNWGLSLRPLEALYAHKKLITNYTDIVKYDFYNENNIYIFDGNNYDGIPAWLEKPLEAIPEKILSKYDVDSWLYRFGE